jgi:hypothetical protein
MWYLIYTEIVPDTARQAPFVNSQVLYAGYDINEANRMADSELNELETRGCEILQLRDNGEYSGFDCLAVFRTSSYRDRYYHLKLYFG